jgi:hypothetical protein
MGAIMKTRKIHAGKYEYTHTDNTKYRIEQFERFIDQWNESRGTEFYWSWYRHDGLTSFGQDEFSSKKETILALEDYLRTR